MNPDTSALAEQVLALYGEVHILDGEHVIDPTRITTRRRPDRTASRQAADAILEALACALAAPLPAWVSVLGPVDPLRAGYDLGYAGLARVMGELAAHLAEHGHLPERRGEVDH